MKIQHILIFITFLCNSCFMVAQNFSIIYDSNGNRISRTVIVLKSALDVQNDADTLKYIEKADDYIVVVFPNPTTGEIKIEIKGDNLIQSAIIKIFDSQGSLIIQSLYTESDVINLAKYSSGFYLMQLDLNGKKQEWKILKE